MAAGLAGDSYDDVFKYGAAGVGGGWILGEGAYNIGERAVEGASNIRDTFREGYYTPEEYKDIVNKESAEKMKKDKDIVSHDRELFGEDQEKATDIRSKLAQYGVSDVSAADNAIKLVLNNDASIEEAASIAQYSKYIDRQSLMDDSVRANIEQGVLDRVGNEEQTRRIMNLTDKYNNVVPQKDLAIERLAKKMEKQNRQQQYEEKKKARREQTNKQETNNTKRDTRKTKKPRTQK